MREKKSTLRFKRKEYSKIGLFSVVIGIIAWCVFISLSIYSFMREGNAEKIVGVIGIFDAFFALLGAGFSLKGFQERDVSYGLSIAGMILNGILFVIYFSLYFMGVSILL